MNFALETVFINKYVVSNKCQRYLSFIEKPKRRGEFLNMLYHGQDFEYSKLRRANAFYKEDILKQVARLSKAPNCYIISVDKKLDGKEMSVAMALDQIGPYAEGIVLIFGECDIVYYCGEPPHNEWLSL
ncbi:hypothetical protein [Hymenobacter sp. BT730]|uniref:hypothetical protein n=1 Tax=Hymenobacter sp. BT730 TaxID=3063332 RepID=UPI0026DEAB0C|nr:hypothetical protein [Hymenobacter sp. BT730]